MESRRKGGQPGNVNAVTHGRHSRARREQRALELAEEHRRYLEWKAKMPATDYGAICDAIAKSKTKR